MTDTIHFEITWDAMEWATLVVLKDNSVNVIPTPNREQTGKGAVSLSYSARSAGAHTITWTLEFPGETLKNLRAYASVNGHPPELLAESASSEGEWPEQGVAS